MTEVDRPVGLSASIICADMLDIGAEIERVNRAKVETIHFDVMDGLFVPRLGLHPEMLRSIRSRTNLPIDVHLMVADPEPYLATFIDAGATFVTVHAENNPHLLRTLQRIRALGAKPGVALNPGTSLSVLDYLLPETDMVLLMGINPGIVGHPLWPPTMGKIADLRARIGSAAGPLISIDGGVNFSSAPQMAVAGADLLVCGTSTIYRPPAPLEQKVRELRALLGASGMGARVMDSEVAA